MKNFLFPTSFRVLGWILFIPATILAVLCYFNPIFPGGVMETIMNDIAIIGLAVGALFIVCSKEPREDEMIRSLRLSALLTSLYVYVALLVLSTIFINGVFFLMFTVFNLVLLPLIYVIVFRVEIYHYYKINTDEE